MRCLDKMRCLGSGLFCTSPNGWKQDSKTTTFGHTWKSGRFSYDNKCPNYKSFGICCHVLAVAEVNHMLPAFIEYFKQQKKIPSLQVWLSWGRKSSEPPRKRARTEVPPFLCTHHSRYSYSRFQVHWDCAIASLPELSKNCASYVQRDMKFR